MTLERLGVDVIEAGFAASSPGDFEGVAAVATRRRRARPSRRSPARRPRTSTPPRQALAGAPPPPHPRLHRDERAAHGAQARPDARRGARARRAGRSPTPREQADEVEFSAEDATRSDRAFLAEVCRARRRGRRDDRQPARHGRLHLAGRVRRAVRRDWSSAARSSPASSSRFTATTTSASPSRTRSPVSEPGATQVECTVNGIGERAGNAVARGDRDGAARARRRVRRRDRDRPGMIRDASALVRELTGYAVAARTSRSSARTRSRTRPASTRTGCSRTPRRTRSSTRPSSASR